MGGPGGAGGAQDGGYAWVVCGACFMAFLINGGFIYTTGMFYIMFQHGVQAGDSAITLITSLNISFHFLICPVAGLLTERYGERSTAMVGSLLATVGFATSSFSTQVYQLCLMYGVVAGVGLGLVWNPSVTIISKYFRKHERSACGIAFCGLGVGSFIFPPIINALEERYGWRGCILIMAGVSAHNLIWCSLYRPLPLPPDSFNELTDNSRAIEYDHQQAISGQLHENGDSITKIVTDKQSLPGGKIPEVLTHENDNEKEIIQNLLDSDMKKYKNGDDIEARIVITDSQPRGEAGKVLALFKIVPFLCLSIHSVLLFFSVFIVYTHFGSYILTLGYTTHDVVLLYMVMGITSTVFRVLTGVLAQITEVNTITLVMACDILLGISTTMLPLTHKLSLMYMYVVMFQVLMSPFNILCPTIVVQIVPKEQIPSAYGITCFFSVPGTALGPPFAALLYGSTQVYSYSFYLAGLLFLLAGLTLLPAAYTSLTQDRDKEQA